MAVHDAPLPAWMHRGIAAAGEHSPAAGSPRAGPACLQGAQQPLPALTSPSGIHMQYKTTHLQYATHLQALQKLRLLLVEVSYLPHWLHPAVNNELPVPAQRSQSPEDNVKELPIICSCSWPQRKAQMCTAEGHLPGSGAGGGGSTATAVAGAACPGRRKRGVPAHLPSPAHPFGSCPPTPAGQSAASPAAAA